MYLPARLVTSQNLCSNCKTPTCHFPGHRRGNPRTSVSVRILFVHPTLFNPQLLRLPLVPDKRFRRQLLRPTLL